MIRILKYNLLLLVSLLFFTQCFEPVDIEYAKNTESVIVIEAVLTDLNEPTTVLVSKTVNMDNSGTSIPVDSAVVCISDNTGQFEQLKQTAPGRYESQQIKGYTGREYTLTVDTENKHYSATEELLPCKLTDSLYIVYLKNHDIYSDGYYIEAKLNIIDDSTQFYRLLFYCNDSLYNGFEDIVLFETKNIFTTVDALIPFTLKQNDTTYIKLFTLTPSVFDYFSTYTEITTGIYVNSTVPPINPPSNISGGALGYFQVSSVLERKIIVR